MQTNKSANAEAWLAENRAALESSNAFVEAHGLPLGLHDPLTLRALLEVIEALKGVSIGGRMQFFLGPRGSLGGLSPLQALERPALRAKVLDIAYAFAES